MVRVSMHRANIINGLVMLFRSTSISTIQLGDYDSGAARLRLGGSPPPRVRVISHLRRLGCQGLLTLTFCPLELPDGRRDIVQTRHRVVSLIGGVAGKME